MKNILSLSFVLLCGLARAQELNCSVQVQAPTIAGTTEKKIFSSLQTSVFEFMNNRKWTKDPFNTEERIECSILINISEEASIDDFSGYIQVQANRQVFKSSYSSLMFLNKDNDFHIRYIEFQPMEFSDNTYISNLTSILAYYAYIILGIDYDSFSPDGGTQYFQKAQQIVSNSQGANEKGWKAFESTKNRYWIVENLLNASFHPLRECIYKYHRLGFDVMPQDVNAGRAVVADAVSLLEKVYNEKPGSYLLQLFFLAKADELVNLFSQGLPEEKTKMVNLLNKIDPGNTGKYNKIVSGG